MKKIGTFTFLLANLLGGFCLSQQPCLAKSMPVRLTRPLKSQLANLFDVLGRVCEVHHFHLNGMSNRDLVEFAVLHNNNLGPYHKTDASGHYHLPVRYVDAVVMQTFGRKVKHESVKGYPYRNGYYVASGSDASEGDRIEVTRLLNLGGNRYVAYASLYDRRNNHLDSKEKMTLRKVTSKGKSRFIVLEYLAA